MKERSVNDLSSEVLIRRFSIRSSTTIIAWKHDTQMYGLPSVMKLYSGSDTSGELAATKIIDTIVMQITHMVAGPIVA